MSSQDESAIGNTTEAASSSNAASIPPPASTAQSSQAEAAAAGSATMTMTETAAVPVENELLSLTLRGRANVTWDQDVIDNEGLGRKSSKRCCIFHKQRAFDESSTDSSDNDSDGSGDSSGDEKKPAAKGNRKIAHPKKGKDAPDYQRFHA